MDGLTLALCAAALASGAVLIIFLVLYRMRKGAKGLAGRVRRPPKKTGDDVCGICFGSVAKEDVIARCGCGQAFHDTCAEPVGACPYCKTSYNELAKEAPDCVACPACGADVAGSVCGCGAVVNRDGTFTCRCGNSIDINDPVCRKCGTEYDLCKGAGR